MTPLLLTALLALGAPNGAEPSPEKIAEAEALAHRSMAEYNVGQFEVALEHATQAYLLDAKPALLYNIGQCQRALRHWDRAEFFYRGYLRDKPTAKNRKQVEGLIAEMIAHEKEETARAARAAVTPPPPVTAPAATAPGPVVVVEALTPAPPSKPSHSHALAIALGAAGAAFAAADVGGGYAVYSYNAGVERANARPGSATYSPATASGRQTAKLFAVVDVVAFVLAAAGVTGAVLTW